LKKRPWMKKRYCQKSRQVVGWKTGGEAGWQKSALQTHGAALETLHQAVVLYAAEDRLCCID